MQQNDLVLLRAVPVLSPYIPRLHMDNVPQNGSTASDRSEMSARLFKIIRSFFTHARSERDSPKAAPANMDGSYF